MKARIMSLCPNEFNKFAANSYIKLREKRLKEKKSFNRDYKIGIMIEVPASAIQSNVLSKYVLCL